MNKRLLLLIGIAIVVFGSIAFASSQYLQGFIFDNKLNTSVNQTKQTVLKETSPVGTITKYIPAPGSSAWFFSPVLGFKFEIPSGFVVQQLTTEVDDEDVVVRTRDDFQTVIKNGTEAGAWRPALTFRAYIVDKKMSLLDWARTLYDIPDNVDIENFSISGRQAVKYVQHMTDGDFTGLIFDMRKESYLMGRIVMFATNSLGTDQINHLIKSFEFAE